MEKIKNELMKFSLSESEAEDVIEILHNEKNISLEKCAEYWEELCFIFDNIEDIDISNTNLDNIQDLLDNKSFRDNNYILRSGRLASIG